MQLHQHNTDSTRQHNPTSTHSTKTCAINSSLDHGAWKRLSWKGSRSNSTGICGNSSFCLLGNQSCSRKTSLHQDCVLPQGHFYDLMEIMWVIPVVSGPCDQGPWQCRALMADSGPGILRTAGHIVGQLWGSQAGHCQGQSFVLLFLCFFREEHSSSWKQHLSLLQPNDSRK